MKWLQLTPRPPRPPKPKKFTPAGPPKPGWRLDPNSAAGEALRELRSKLLVAGDGADSEGPSSVAGAED